MPGEPFQDLTFNRLTLRYRSPELEAEYVRHAPAALIRTVRPLLYILIPMIIVLGILDYVDLISVPVGSAAAAEITIVLVALLLVALYASRWIDYAIIVTFFVTTALLLSQVHDEETLQRMMAGLLMVVMLANFVGVRYLEGVFTSLGIIILIVAFTMISGYSPGTLIDAGVFMVIGICASTSLGYTIDRQRRRLFAQVKQIAAERDLHEQQALHDPLTDLPNRILLRERMGQSLARSRRHKEQLAVLFIDLDDFKSVNDSYGHAVGDQVLKGLARTLLSRVRDEDTVARLGGDEFVILSEQVNDDNSAKIAADRIQAAVAEPVVVTNDRADTLHINITCSIGIALCPRDGDDLDELIDRADKAMYNAKRSGKANTKFFRADGYE